MQPSPCHCLQGEDFDDAYGASSFLHVIKFFRSNKVCLCRIARVVGIQRCWPNKSRGALEIRSDLKMDCRVEETKRKDQWQGLARGKHESMHGNMNHRSPCSPLTMNVFIDISSLFSCGAASCLSTVRKYDSTNEACAYWKRSQILRHLQWACIVPCSSCGCNAMTFNEIPTYLFYSLSSKFRNLINTLYNLKLPV